MLAPRYRSLGSKTWAPIYPPAARPSRYVTEKEPDTNTVYVSRQYHEGEKRRDAFSCDRFSWTTPRLRPDPALPLQCKVRHGPHLYGCTLEVRGAGGGGGGGGGGGEGMFTSPCWGAYMA